MASILAHYLLTKQKRYLDLEYDLQEFQSKQNIITRCFR